jgi:hypothetical protein
MNRRSTPLSAQDYKSLEWSLSLILSASPQRIPRLCGEDFWLRVTTPQSRGGG